MLPTYYQEFIAISRYARWDDRKQRRELWDETVARCTNSFAARILEKTGKGDAKTIDELFAAIKGLEVMPSMRVLMTAGPALERSHVAAYNCAYLPVDHTRAFDEAMYILMCGTGVGYSVERQYVEKLPPVPVELRTLENLTIKVPDSKEGWSGSFRELLEHLWEGIVPEWDVSDVRPAGARLKTFGGRASGPEPLVDLFRFTVSLFRKAVGRKLTSLEAHDLMCKIADIVVVGGVRRSAMICLSDLNDIEMRDCKLGEVHVYAPHRGLANNSAVYNSRPSPGIFLKEWTALYDSHNGERGIFNRAANRAIAARNGRRDASIEFGTNPCSEIILRPNQFCNLTEVVVREDDDVNSLMRKVRLATIMGTIQATYTNFKYLRKVWQKTTEDEALLGVSLTGILDHPTLAYDRELLNVLRSYAVVVNREWAALLGIKPAAAITCVKPSGTVSQLVNSASGIHTRHAPYYIRRVRADSKDPLSSFLRDVGVPCEVDLWNKSNLVFSFPVKAPAGARTRKDLTAIEMLNIWKTFQLEYCEHKPSITVNVKEHEWVEVAAWVYENFDICSGIAFLPYDDAQYPQMPYEEITEAQYEQLMKAMPEKIDWIELQAYEKEDNTTGTQELNCSAGVCEVVSIGRVE